MTAPEFIPTNHTLLRMQQRRISFEEILAVLRSPDTSYLSPQGGEVLIGHPNGRRIKVVIEPGSSPPVVITVAD